MGKFAFITNLAQLSDINGKLRFSRFLPEIVLERIFRFFPPIMLSAVKDLKIDDIKGWLLAVPFTDKQLMGCPNHLVVRSIIKAGQMAERLGADFVGIGGIPQLGNASQVLAENIKIPVETGYSYAVFAALQVVKKAASVTGQSLKELEAVVIGADSEIGKIFALLLAKEVKGMTLAGSQINQLKSLANKIFFDTGLSAKITSDGNKAWDSCKIIIMAEHNLHYIPKNITQGTIVYRLVKGAAGYSLPYRKDLFVVEDPVVEVPGNFHFYPPYPGLPIGNVGPEMAEIMLLSIENQKINFSRPFDTVRVEEIGAFAQKSGFRTVGFIGNGEYHSFFEDSTL